MQVAFRAAKREGSAWRQVESTTTGDPMAMASKNTTLPNTAAWPYLRTAGKSARQFAFVAWWKKLCDRFWEQKLQDPSLRTQQGNDTLHGKVQHFKMVLFGTDLVVMLDEHRKLLIRILEMLQLCSWCLMLEELLSVQALALYHLYRIYWDDPSSENATAPQPESERFVSKKKRTTVTTGSLSTRGWTQGIAVDTFFSSEDPLLHWLLHPFSVLGETTRMPPQKLAKSGKLFHQQKIHLYWTHKDHSSWSIDGEIFGEPISGRKSWEFYKITPNNPSLKHPTGVDTVLHLQIVGRHRHLFRFFIQRVHQKKEPLLH